MKKVCYCFKIGGSFKVERYLLKYLFYFTIGVTDTVFACSSASDNQRLSGLNQLISLLPLETGRSLIAKWSNKALSPVS